MASLRLLGLSCLSGRLSVSLFIYHLKVSFLSLLISLLQSFHFVFVAVTSQYVVKGVLVDR